jgi:hypothetical protein
MRVVSAPKLADMVRAQIFFRVKELNDPASQNATPEKSVGVRRCSISSTLEADWSIEVCLPPHTNESSRSTRKPSK